MSDWINRVFVDGRYRYGGLAKEDLKDVKFTFRTNALKVLSDTGADHVIYCHIEYDENNEIESADFYSGIPLDDETFHRRIEGVSGFIGAVHKRDTRGPK